LQSLAMLQNVVYIVTTVFWMVRHHVYFGQEMVTQQMSLQGQITRPEHLETGLR